MRIIWHTHEVLLYQQSCKDERGCWCRPTVSPVLQELSFRSLKVSSDLEGTQERGDHEDLYLEVMDVSPYSNICICRGGSPDTMCSEVSIVIVIAIARNQGLFQLGKLSIPLQEEGCNQRFNETEIQASMLRLGLPEAKICLFTPSAQILRSPSDESAHMR